MVLGLFTNKGRLAAARAVLEHLAQHLDARVSVKLWDDSVIPLGPNADPNVRLAFRSAGTLSSLMRWPTLDNLLRHYATGRIDVEGTDLHLFLEQARMHGMKERLKKVSKAWCAWKLLPLWLTPGDKSTIDYRYASEAGIGDKEGRKNEDFIQFHYDISNEFYQLFLDKEMQYTCNYFTDWNNTSDQAAMDKMEIICRRLRLKPGEHVLEMGCGWGGLACYMARNYGVTVYAVTLSEQQVLYGQEKVRRLGLQDRVKIELKDAIDVTGTYDKVATIGMFEHLGIDNFERYMGKIYDVLRDRGLALVHTICRGAKPTGKSFRKSRPEHRWFRKHIFPGGELGNVGDLCKAFEAMRFQVHDVEGWRDHYAATTRQWTRKLAEHETEAIRLVGPQKYRLWMVYLSGMSMGFHEGTLRLFQVLGSKHGSKGHSRMPCTRADLYDRPYPSQISKQAAA